MIEVEGLRQSYGGRTVLDGEEARHAATVRRLRAGERLVLSDGAGAMARCVVEGVQAGRDPLLVGVLKGAIMVMADLSRRLSLPVEQDWMAISSYGSGTKSSGVVRIMKDLERDITGRDVLIVEDIVDSGLTLSWIMSNLLSRGPASVEVCTLLRKPDAMKVDLKLRYVGFDIPNEFVVGYGLDHAENFRHLPYIASLQ